MLAFATVKAAMIFVGESSGTKYISLSEQLFLVIRSVIQKEIINIVPTAIKVGEIRFPRYKR